MQQYAVQSAGARRSCRAMGKNRETARIRVRNQIASEPFLAACHLFQQQVYLYDAWLRDSCSVTGLGEAL
ncbi:hypothetical protein HYQ44_006052 [Verticillium longisporum]|nr:hypothetical protein HYQ44_006052 [Verticillium longisporum]